MTTHSRATRAQTLTDLGVVVSELLDQVTTRTRVLATAVPSKAGKRTPKRVEHQTTAPGLYVQLEQAAGVRPMRPRPDVDTARTSFLDTARRLGASELEARRMVAGYGVRRTALGDSGPTSSPRYGADITSHAKPGSRPPMSLDAIDLLARIDTDVVALRRRADKAAGIPTLDRTRGFRGEIRHLTWLLSEPDLLPDAWPITVYRAARSWAADARVALSYLAPMMTLNVVCPDCGGELRVRADATSDVWCLGILEGPVLEDDDFPLRCGAVWPRLLWITLLDQAKQTTA